MASREMVWMYGDSVGDLDHIVLIDHAKVVVGQRRRTLCGATVTVKTGREPGAKCDACRDIEFELLVPVDDQDLLRERLRSPYVPGYGELSDATDYIGRVSPLAPSSGAGGPSPHHLAPPRIGRGPNVDLARVAS
jgi:hypothetical protein